MLEKLWDDVVAGPHTETGLEKLRKATTSRPLVINKGSRRRCSFIFSTLASGSMQFLSKLTEMMKLNRMLNKTTDRHAFLVMRSKNC